MEDVSRENLSEFLDMLQHELTTRGYRCNKKKREPGFQGDFLICKPFGDPTIERAYGVSIPTIFENDKYVVGEAKKKVELTRCSDAEKCISGRIIGKYHTRDPEKLAGRIADDMEGNFVEPSWM